MTNAKYLQASSSISIYPLLWELEMQIGVLLAGGISRLSTPC